MSKMFLYAGGRQRRKPRAGLLPAVSFLRAFRLSSASLSVFVSPIVSSSLSAGVLTLPIIVSAIFTAFAANAYASEITHDFFSGKTQSGKFFQEKRKGWFAYEKETLPIIKKKNNETANDRYDRLIPLAPITEEKLKLDWQAERRFLRSIPYDNLDSLSAKEFKESYEKVTEIATMRLDFESVIARQRMTKFSSDQAVKLAEVSQIAASMNEFIDPSLAASQYQNNMVKAEREKAQRDFLEINKDNLAIAVFYGGEDHPSYQYQRSAIEAFEREFPNTETLWIDAVNSPEIKDKIGLVTLPETWLAWKRGGDIIWRRLKAGAITADEIPSKALFIYEKTIAADIFAKGGL